MAAGGEIASDKFAGMQVERFSSQWIHSINLIAAGVDFL
jgi:hypothetical protein